MAYEKFGGPQAVNRIRKQKPKSITKSEYNKLKSLGQVIPPGKGELPIILDPKKRKAGKDFIWTKVKVADGRKQNIKNRW